MCVVGAVLRVYHTRLYTLWGTRCESILLCGCKSLVYYTSTESVIVFAVSSNYRAFLYGKRLGESTPHGEPNKGCIRSVFGQMN